jgi:hypothetical protein
MPQWTEDELIQRVGASKFFSLQLDESSDVQGLSLLLIFTRYVWNDEPYEDMLCCEPIIRSTSEDIFNTLHVFVKVKALDWMKRVGICTDFFFFFFYWRYNPLWVLAFSVILFHSSLSLHNFLHPLIPILCVWLLYSYPCFVI